MRSAITESFFALFVSFADATIADTYKAINVDAICTHSLWMPIVLKHNYFTYTRDEISYNSCTYYTTHANRDRYAAEESNYKNCCFHFSENSSERALKCSLLCHMAMTLFFKRSVLLSTFAICRTWLIFIFGQYIWLSAFNHSVVVCVPHFEVEIILPSIWSAAIKRNYHFWNNDFQCSVADRRCFINNIVCIKITRFPLSA